MNYLKVLLTALLVTLLKISFAQNQSELKEGWNYFIKNEYQEAIDHFSALYESSQDSESLLARSLVYSALYKDKKAFEDLSKYYYENKNADIALKALWSFHYGDKSKDEIAFLESIVEQKHGTLKALAIEALASNYWRTNNIKKAKKLYAQLGSVDDWSILGEFENVSESGFNKNFGALEKPQDTSTFINKLGVDVSWFDCRGPRQDKWLDFEYFFYASNSIIYAQNFCTSPEDRDVQFRLGVSGSIKVWVNDQLIYSESEERNNGIDSYIFNAHLREGNNRILLQLGESEASNCNFMLRITDENGNPYEDLIYEKQFLESYYKENKFSPKTIEDEVIAHYKNAIKNDPENIQNYILLDNYYQYKDFMNADSRLLAEARNRFPDNNYFRVKQLLAFVRDGNTTQVNTLIEEIKIKDPDNILGLNLRFDDAMDLDNYEEAQEILDNIEGIQGKSENYYLKAIEIASAQENREELIDLVDDAYYEYPDDYDFVSLKVEILNEIQKNPYNASSILSKYLKKHYSESAMRDLASLEFQKGTYTDIQKGLKIYNQIIDNEPIGIGNIATVARINFYVRKYGVAEEYMRIVTSQAPYVGSYHAELAETYEQIEEKADASSEYQLAIELNPYDYSSRKALRELREEGSVFDNFEEYDVYEVYENAPDKNNYPEDNSLILAMHKSIVFYEGGGNEEKTTLAVKVFNSSGVDNWKEYRIPVYGNQRGSIDKAETLKANGSRVPAETNGSYVVFENLEAGDAIHVTYRLENHYSGKLANHLWGNASFQYFLPSLSNKLEVLVPKNSTFRFKDVNGPVELKIDSNFSSKNIMYTWVTENTDAIEHETYMPQLEDIGPTIHYTTFPDWNFVSNWYKDLVKAKTKSNFEVEQTVSDIFPNGYSQFTEYEKAKKIYDYIVTNVRYRSISFLQSGLIPQRPSTTLSAMQGDCKDVSVLFATLCKEVGIKANLMLINSRDNGEKEMMLPSINFDHCIATVQLDSMDSPYFIELTTDLIGFANRTKTVEGAFSLEIPIHEDKNIEADYVKSKNSKVSECFRNSSISFNESNLNLSRNTTKVGLAAAYIRSNMKDEGPEQQEKIIREGLSDEFTTLKINSLEFTSGLNNPSDTIKYTYSYTATNATSSIGRIEIIQIPFTDGLRDVPSFISTEERTYPVEIWDYFSAENYNEEIIISIPSGKRLSEVPKSKTIETKDIRYEVTYKKRGTKLYVNRNFVIKDGIVSPEDYLEFKSAMEKIIKSDSQNLGFQS